MPSSTQLPIAAIVTSIFYLKFSSSAVTSKSTEVLNVDSSITLTHTFNVASCGVYVVTSIEKEVERRRSTPATLTWRRTRRPSVPPKVAAKTSCQSQSPQKASSLHLSVLTQVLVGMRGMTRMLRETSLLDPDLSLLVFSHVNKFKKNL
ncbi:hypothetical protein ACQJBY_036196 [Aegilops geniculata]